MTITTTAYNLNIPYSGNYVDFVRNNIIGSEGSSSSVYADTVYVPTIGYGFALILYNGTASAGSKYSIRSDVSTAFSYANDTTLSGTATTALSNIVTALNAGNTTLAASYYSAFSSVSADITQAKSLVDYALNKNIYTVEHNATSVDGSSIGSIFTNFESTHANSNELAALYNLIYQGPGLIGERMADALYNDNRALAWYEILYDNASTSIPGVMDRYQKQAELFSLTNHNADANSVAHELNTLFNGIDYALNSVYSVIKAHDSIINFEDEIAPQMKVVEDFYTHGKSIDFIQVADTDWISGGTINAKDSAAHASDHLTNNLIIGSTGADTINGGAGSDYLYGGGDNDTLNGGDDDDWLAGGAGHDTLNGGNDNISLGSYGDIADYSNAAAGVTVDLSTQSTSNDGDGSYDTLSGIEGVAGSAFDDNLTGSSGVNIFYGSNGNDIIDGNDSNLNDVIDYEFLSKSITVAATFPGIFTVSKGTSSDLGDDTIGSIGSIIGTNFDDHFSGTFNSFYTIGPSYGGGAGNDTYSFNLSTDTGWATVGDSLVNQDTGLNTINITNFNSSTMIMLIGGADSLATTITVRDRSTHTDILDITVGHSATDVTDILKINGTPQLLSDFTHYFITTSSIQIDSDHFGDIYNDYISPGSGGGGGAIPTVSGGTVTAIQYSPTYGGFWIPPVYAHEILHAPVITSWHAGGGSISFTSDDYVKEIDFNSGISQSDVRFTLSGSQGNMSLDIHLDALGQTFTIPYFETGKTINGVFLYDTALHSYIQDADSGSQTSSGGGVFSGSFVSTTLTEPTPSTSSYSVTYYLESIVAGGHTFNMQGDLTFIGTSSADTLYGLDARDDTIQGLGGADNIYGYGGDDTLIGGTGNDYLAGGYGDDTYVIAVGDGADTVYEATSQGNDTIHLSGYAPTDIRMWTDSSGYLHLENRSNTGDNITIQAGTTGTGQYESTVGSYVEQIVFDDSTTWSLTGGLSLEGSSSADSLYGTQYADVLKGMGGADNIYGNTGNDTLIGGVGSDYLAGGTGNDTYVFAAGDGADTVYETTGQGTDTIELNGYTPTDVRLYTDSSGYLHIVSNANSADNITIQAGTTGTGQYESTIGDYVEQIVFDDTTTWSLTGGLTLEGSSIADSLYGTQYDDVLKGMGGADNIYANTGNDTLIGGTGADYLAGGTGNDTYVFAAGSGADTIYETTGQGTDTVEMNGYLPSDIRLWTDASGYLHLENRSDTSDNITIQAGTTGTGNAESTIGDYVEQVIFDNSTVWDLTGGLTIEGSSTGETLYGTQYDDTIKGMAGNDSIYGNRGDDVLIGGSGTDYLAGGTGDDTYVFAAGSGTDTIYEATAQGADTVEMNGYLPSDIRLWTDSSGYLHLENKSDTSDNITIQAGMTGTGNAESTIGDYVEQVIFDNATVWDLTGGLNIEGSSTGETLYGTQYDDTIKAMAGNDSIYGNRGDDVLIGGSGTDYLAGGVGDDTYVFAAGSGTDTIYESTAQGSDTVEMNGYLPSDIRLWTDSSGYLHLENKSDTSDNITIQAATTGLGTYESTIGDYVEHVVFDNSTVWDLTGGLNIEGSSTGESLYGTQYDDTIKGMGGNDTLYGNRGDDVLTGGTGTDYLYGGTGDDTYVFTAGDGADTVVESTSQGTDTIDMSTYSSSDIRLWTDTSGYLHVESKLDPSDNITVNAATTGLGTYESTVGDYVEQIVLSDTTISLTGGLSLEGTSSSESLYGTAHDDTIKGMGGNDTLYGNSGNDTLNGGTGTNYLYGGSGADIFAFDTTSATNYVQDFSAGQGDKLDVSALLTTFDPVTEAIADFVQITESSGNSILSVDLDGTGTTYGFTQIATISGVTGITDVDDLITNGHLIV